MKEIILVSPGIPFGPDTLSHMSLGGSETAALMMIKELKKAGPDNIFTIFCNLPKEGFPGYVPSGHITEDKIRWCDVKDYEKFISNSPVDLLIVARDPQFFRVPHQAKKAVLWMHDLATYAHRPYIMSVSWNFNEIWTVSQWHKKQVHKILGFPKDRIWATRNGIVKFDEQTVSARQDKSLLYSARPERGLEYLVRPGGIMEQLPDFHLNVTMYENFPEHMMEYYNMLWAQIERLPNVTNLGVKKQDELRTLMAEHWAYVYPTSFEETSCIIARECIEQRLPVICTRSGALPETLKKCAHYETSPYKDIGTEEWSKKFSQTVRDLHVDREKYIEVQTECERRSDLYWDQVAKSWLRRTSPPKSKPFSLAYSLIQDSDVIPAKAYLDSLSDDEHTPGTIGLQKQVDTLYPFLTGEISMEEHYKGIYEYEEEKNVVERQKMLTLEGHQRFTAMCEYISKLEPGDNVVEYGCAEGPVIFGLALRFPGINFYGIDFVKENIDLCLKYARENSIKNVAFGIGSTDNWPTHFRFAAGNIVLSPDFFDAGIIAEVLEHTVEPWDVLEKFESHIVVDGKILITVPQGSWEWGGLIQNTRQWHWRAHIWHIDKFMMRTMLKDKKPTFAMLTEGFDRSARTKGHMFAAYGADYSSIPKIDPMKKVQSHRARQSLAACMIAMDDEDCILKCLNSIQFDINILQIAYGPSQDHTKEFVRDWANERGWIDYREIDVPRIEAKKFGFDDARNASLEGIETDWILWIDCDEYLSMSISPYLRDNAFDCYSIHQHHFTCEPRGAPAQLDKPARIIRNLPDYKFYGKVHEHAERKFNHGPGYTFLISDIDIGHTGYVNDQTRMGRFQRNFPLLEWDREVYPDRKLGKYLWLRDMIHKLRLTPDQNIKKQLAEDSIAWYEKYMDDFTGVGGGHFHNQALSYYSEALIFLNQGLKVRIALDCEGQQAQYEGAFKSAKDAVSIAAKGLKEQFDIKKSRYTQ